MKLSHPIGFFYWFFYTGASMHWEKIYLKWIKPSLLQVIQKKTLTEVTRKLETLIVNCVKVFLLSAN